MKDMLKHLESLRRDAAECAGVSAASNDRAKRALFAKLAAHHQILAAEVQRAIERQASLRNARSVQKIRLADNRRASDCRSGSRRRS